MSHVLLHKACPACRENGKDRSGNNLAVYSDGHSFCFACGFHSNGSKVTKIRNNFNQRIVLPEEVNLPRDITEDLPQTCLNWLRSYELTSWEIQNSGAVWSPFRELLIFPIKRQRENQTLGWIGRYFGKEAKPKWIIKGKIKEEIIFPLGIEKLVLTNTVVFVEDLISAIKLSRYTVAVPIFGAVIQPYHLLKAKALGAKKVLLWLDPDKQKETLQFATKYRMLGLPLFPIFTENDPKEHTAQFLQDKLSEYT